MDVNKAKACFWILLDILIAAAVVGLIFFAMPAIERFGGSLVPSRVMTVSAEGKTTVTPDLAQASFSVISRGKNPSELADSNNQKMSAVIDFVKSLGIDAKDIKTVNYDLSPEYKYDPQSDRRFITGYALTETIAVKMRNFKKIAEIIGGLTPLGVNQIGGISFSVEDMEKYLSAARAEAFDNVRAKAADISLKGGVKLGRVLNIQESQGGVPAPYYESMRSYAAAAPAVAAPAIEPGSQEIRDEIAVTYELK